MRGWAGALLSHLPERARPTDSAARSWKAAEVEAFRGTSCSLSMIMGVLQIDNIHVTSSPNLYKTCLPSCAGA